MKQIFSLILTLLLICRSCGTMILLAHESPVSNDNETIRIPSTNPEEEFLELTTSPCAITLTSFDEVAPTDAVAFAKGTSLEEIKGQLENMSQYFFAYDALENDYYLEASVWSLGELDTSTPGLYQIWVEPDLEDCSDATYLLADGLVLPRQIYTISIQIPGELDINCSAPGRGFIRFPWIFSEEQTIKLEELQELGLQDSFATVWLREDNAEWVELSDGFLFVSDALNLFQYLFEYDHTYDLRVGYPGGETGILRFQYGWPLTIISYSEGKRDGGNLGGGHSQTGSQPAPTPPTTLLPGLSVDDSISEDMTIPEDDSVSEDMTIPEDDSVSEDMTVHEDDSVSEDMTVHEDDSVSEDMTIPSWTQTYQNITHSTENINPLLITDYQEDFDFSNIPTQSQMAIFPLSLVESSSLSTEIVKPVNTNAPANNEPLTTFLEPLVLLANTAEAMASPITIAVESDPPPQVAPATLEFYSPEETIISGLRLRDLCNEEERVVFGSGGLTASIPSKLLLDLDLSDSDTLSIQLTQPETKQVRLVVNVVDKPIADLTGTILRLRHTLESEHGEFVIRNEQNQDIADVVFDGGFLQFPSNTAGTYTVFEESGDLESQASIPLQLPALGGSLLAGGGIMFFWRRLHG